MTYLLQYEIPFDIFPIMSKEKRVRRSKTNGTVYGIHFVSFENTGDILRFRFAASACNLYGILRLYVVNPKTNIVKITKIQKYKNTRDLQHVYYMRAERQLFTEFVFKIRIISSEVGKVKKQYKFKSLYLAEIFERSLIYTHKAGTYTGQTK